MKKFAFMLFFAALTCCPPANAAGLIFTQVTRPITATCVPTCNLCCLRCGQSTSTNILWLFEFGDAGIDAATKCGCVRQIHHVDETISSFLFLFKKTTTKVYGE